MPLISAPTPRQCVSPQAELPPYSCLVPGNMWDEPEEPAGELDLRLLRVAAAPLEPAGTALRVRLETTRGNIDGILHPVEGGTGAVIVLLKSSTR